MRKIIREVLEEEAWLPGRWYPGQAEPVTDDEIETMGTGGMGLHRKDRSHRSDDIAAAGLDEEDLDESDLDEAKKKKGLWANIHAKRKRGERPARPGEKGYPKTLDIETQELKELRAFIRHSVLLENPCGPGVAADPTDVKGFYPYELERGVDIQGYWYKSPGDKGSSDPMRPEDPQEYVGQKPPADSAVNTPGADAAEDMAPPPVSGQA